MHAPHGRASGGRGSGRGEDLPEVRPTAFVGGGPAGRELNTRPKDAEWSNRVPPLWKQRAMMSSESASAVSAAATAVAMVTMTAVSTGL